MSHASDLPDPRAFPDSCAAAPDHARLYALSATSLAAESRQRADALDREIRGALAQLLASDGASLAALFTGAPSVATTRHLWRSLDAAWRDGAAARDAGLCVAVFALPVVIASGSEGAEANVTHPGILDDASALAAILREHGAIGGNANFALSEALVGPDAIDIARLPEIFRWTRLPEAELADIAPRALPPSPLAVPAGREGVHLRFLVGSALARPGADLFGDSRVGKWGMPFTKELSRQLALVATSVLALPRAPQRPLPAVRAGRAAQREVGAQIFASNAIRKLRASAGEPAAVISVHRAHDAPGGGELRLSLSSPFAPRDAEGFRCPLHPLDRVGDVAQMLVDLLGDCRVTDIRIAAGVHADRDPASGRTLLFKPDALPLRAAAN